MSFKVDLGSIRTVRIHKEQFDAIDKKANAVILTCIEDGRVIAFNRADSEKDKINRLDNNMPDRLLLESDVIKAVDKHTNDCDELDDDISCILEKINSVAFMETSNMQIRNAIKEVVRKMKTKSE